MLNTSNLNYFIQRFLPEETPEEIINLNTFLVHILLIIIFFFISRYALEKFFDANPAGKIDFRNKQSTQRVWTINNLMRNFSMYILYFIFIYMFLDALGFQMRTLVAGAGIAGVAIGLGAQDLINDMINGFFIIFENHFEVGDLVEITGEEIVGTIQDLGIRTTTIQAANGDTYYIPNSQISIINNKSRQNRQITIEIPVADETDFKKFEDTMSSITELITEKYESVIQEKPTIVGFVRGADQTFNYRIAFNVAVGKDYMHTSHFYREYLIGLQENDIKIPSSVYDEHV